jgi:hypothetical protein
MEIDLNTKTTDIMKLFEEFKDNPHFIKKLLKLQLETIYDAGKIDGLKDCSEMISRS